MAEGTIRSLYLKNFLTYSEFTINFEPGLNIIYGPNGTGKSSILSAILLIFGASPKILNRSTNITDFIKFTQNEALIQAEIHLKDRTIVIKRSIRRNAHPKSIWFLDGKPATENDINALVKQLKINLANLCNFLPQDRVTDFFKMSPQELLLALEQTIDDGDLIKSHEILITKFNEKTEKTSIVQIKKNELSQLQQRQQILAEEVKKYESWKSTQDQIKIMEMKLDWMKYDKARLELKETREKLAQAEKIYRETTETFLPQRKELADHENQVSGIDKNLSSYADLLSYSSKNIKDITKTLDIKVSELKMAIASKQEVIRLKRDNKDKLDNMRRHLTHNQQDYNVLQKKYEEEKDKIRDIDNQIDELIKSRSPIEAEIQSFEYKINNLEEEKLRLSHQLQSLKNNRSRLLEVVRSKSYDTYRAIDTIKNIESIFEHPINDPLLFQINLRNSDDAKYLESHISRRDLYAFISDNSNDVQTFIRELREKLSLRVSCLLCGTEAASLPSPDKSIFKKFNLRCFMRDIFIAPPLALSFLCEAYHVQKIPIFNELSDAQIEQVTKIPNLACFYTPTEKYIIKVSAYTKLPSVTTFNIMQNTQKILSKGVDEEELKNIEESINNNEKDIKRLSDCVNSLKTKIHTIDRSLEHCKLQKRQINELKTKINTINSSIRTKQFEIDNLQSLIDSSDARVRKCEEQIKMSLEKSYEVSKGMKKILLESHLSAKETANLCAKRAYLKRKMDVIKNNMDGNRELVESQKEQIHLLRREESQKKAHTQKLLERAQATSGVTNKRPLSKELKNKFKEIPDETSEIMECLAKLQAASSASCNFDPDIMHKFDEINKTIAKLDQYINEQDSKLQSAKTEEEELKQRWLNKIKEIIKPISHRFQTFFAKIKCQGHIQLIEDSNNNYKNFALGLMVSYRPEEQAIQLNHNRHSGGEKAVAIMLFLMSIQQLSLSPFKMVDEINQGMDPSNERIVFDIMAETMSNLASTSQYFFLSPKILPDLTYNQNMTVHTIFNGQLVKLSESTLSDISNTVPQSTMTSQNL